MYGCLTKPNLVPIFSGRPREHRHRRASEFSANRSAEYVHYDHASYERDRFTSRNGTGPSSEIDNARETPHSSHEGDEGLGAMADGPS